MSVPISSADLSRPDAGGALAGWEQPAAVTSRSHVPRAFTPAPTEAVASESPPPVEPQSDTELLSAFVQRRDADAFTEIVQRYRLLVYRVALRAVDDRHLADDVFQATFLVLAQSAHKIKHTEVLAAWLHGTARNIARRAMGNQYAEQKQLKDWAKQTLAQKGEEMATSTEADPFEELARRNEQQLLDEELQQLPESSRAPLVLFYLEKKTQAEIAQIMGLSVEAVEGRLKRAKQELRTRLIRRGVLLSTVVAAATVLTPSITLAAPAVSLVSATVTTALGTAALGSTALGATAVTGAATSSKLAVGSATASTLAAQEIALMSITSKATAMLITSVASTTLISGLVLGGMVGMFSMAAGGSSPTASHPINAQSELQGVINESSDPGLISPAEDDQVQFALVEPETTIESNKQSPAQAEKVDENLNVSKPVTYQVGGLSADDLKDADDYAQSLGLTVLLHRTTQSFVVRATNENHRKLSNYLSEIRKKREARASVQFELFSARAKLAKLLKEFDEYHPDVKQARNEIAAIEKELTEPPQKPLSAEIQPDAPKGSLDSAAHQRVIFPTFGDLIEIQDAETIINLPPPFEAELSFPERVSIVDSFDGKLLAAAPISPQKLRIKSLAPGQNQLLVTGESDKKYRIYIQHQDPKDPASQLTVLNVQVRQQEKLIGKLRKQIEVQQDRGIEPPKGVVTMVDRATRTVLLNIGTKDKLKTQTTFSVTDKMLGRAISGVRDIKARIEVVDVGESSSVARIVEEDPKRPIQVGDSIYSPVWSEDETTEVALIGNGDLNGDLRKDDKDRQMLRAVVGNARGEITLEVNDEGARVPADAKITAQTKWLVVGDLGNPSKGANDPAALARLQAIHKQHEDLILEAREHGVKIVSLNDFLTYMGWKPETRLIVGPIFVREPLRLQIGQERLLTGVDFHLGDLASVVSDRPDLVQVVDKTTIRAVQDGTVTITVTDVNGKTATTQVEVPRQYIRSVSLLRNLNPVEKTIYEVFRRQEQLEFPEQTLDQFADSLSAKYQIPVKVDWQALEAAGVAKSATVSLSGLKRVEHALTDILSDVGGKRLEFYVDNSELHFTTQEAMKTTTRVREYDLSSLGEGHLNYDLPFPGDGELDFALQYADSLSQEITRQGKVLSFNAPLSNHKKFERFLAMLPELLKEPISTHAPPAVHKKIEQFLAMEAVNDNAGVVQNTSSEPVSTGSEEKKAESGQPAVDPVVDQNSNEQRAVTHPLEGIDAEKLQDVVTFAESLPGTVSLDAATHSLVVLDTPENQDKVSGYLTQLRESQETELKHKVEILAARKRLAAKVKEFGKDHPEVRKAQFAASKLERDIAEKSQGTQSAEKFPITTTIFQADDEAIKQITDPDALGKLIPKKDAKKKFESLTGKKKVVIIWESGLQCRVGQPSRFFSGGESLLEPAPEDAIWVGQKLESVEFGDIGQVMVLDKKSRDGQRVLKYELEFTKTSYGNASKYEGIALPLSFGRVFRGYAVVPDPKSEGVLIGPVETAERTSAEGVTREVSTYLWIRQESLPKNFE